MMTRYSVIIRPPRTLRRPDPDPVLVPVPVPVSVVPASPRSPGSSTRQDTAAPASSRGTVPQNTHFQPSSDATSWASAWPITTVAPIQAETTVRARETRCGAMRACRYAYDMGMNEPANSPCRARRATPVPRDVTSGSRAVTTVMARTLMTMTVRRPQRVASGPLTSEPAAWAKANAVVDSAADSVRTPQAAASSGMSGMVTYIWPTTSTPMRDTVVTVAANGAVRDVAEGASATDNFDIHRSCGGVTGPAIERPAMRQVPRARQETALRKTPNPRTRGERTGRGDGVRRTRWGAPGQRGHT